MEALTSAGHAIIAEKNNLDAGCKEIFGCKDMAAFVVKNCIPEYKNLSLKKISGLISDNMEVGSHVVDDIPKEADEQEADDPSSDESPEKIEEKKNESKSTNEGDGILRCTFRFEVSSQAW